MITRGFCRRVQQQLSRERQQFGDSIASLVLWTLFAHTAITENGDARITITLAELTMKLQIPTLHVRHVLLHLEGRGYLQQVRRHHFAFPAKIYNLLQSLKRKA